MQEEPEKLIGFNSATDDHIRQVVQLAIQNQQIIVLPTVPIQQIHAGGTNLCPNSDLAWSQMAATTGGITPATAGATNLEVYRVTRQIVDANIGAQRLRTVEADAWIPIWERVQGVAELGAVDGADNYDIAFQLNNNWLVGNKKWYVRVAVATVDTDPLPVGSRLFAGFWVVRAASQGWVTGGNFTIDHKIFGIPGSREFNYKVIAKTDTGVSLESQVLNITNVPDTLDQDTYIRLTYAAAAGFIEFEVYREDVATGEIRQIARDRNSAQLVAYDSGQEGRLETAFPTATGDQFRAYAEVPIDAISIDLGKTFHNLAARIPASFDTSDVVNTYLRIGIVHPTTVNRQVWIDTIWAGESYNIWSPSPYDDYPSPPSTTMTSGSPVGGGSTGEPPSSGGGSSCVWSGHDLRLKHGWVSLKDATDTLVVDNGFDGSNIEKFRDGETAQYVRFEFDCGLVILASLSHRFIRSFLDHSGVGTEALKVGDRLQGGYLGEPREILIIKKDLVNATEPISVRAVKVWPESENKFYAVGDSEIGWYVYSHNAKSSEEIG